MTKSRFLVLLFLVVFLVSCLCFSSFAVAPEASSASAVYSEDTANSSAVNVFVVGDPDAATSLNDDTWLDGGSGTGLFESLFGDYRPYDAAGLASIDWAWIADVVGFLLLVAGLIKLVGGVLRRV